MRALLTGIRTTEAIVATAAYAAVAILLMTDVIGREIFGAAILGLQQIAVYGAIVAGFLGLTLATSDNAHLRPEFLDFVTAPLDGAARRLGDALSGLFFFGDCIFDKPTL